MSVRAIIGTAFAVLLISASAALGQQTPEGLLQSGIYAGRGPGRPRAGDRDLPEHPDRLSRESGRGRQGAAAYRPLPGGAGPG